jgi:hypothetical protein
VKPKHPWEARLFVALTMLILAFVGIILTDLRKTGNWEYWNWIVPIYAALALWLSWYMRRKTAEIKKISLWHEVLHWLGAFGAVILIDLYAHMGLMSQSLSSLSILTLLAFNVFTLGIYMEPTFLLIGLVLGLFAAVVAFALKFLYVITIPTLFIGITIISYMVWHSHKRAQ